MEFPISIRRYLPHREPMLMVDDILSLNDDFIETNFKIKSDNIFLEDGFLSEVGIIENAAQTCSGIVGRPHFDANKDDENYRVLGYISRIKSVKLLGLPKVDSLLITKGELLSIHPVGEIYSCEMKCHTYNNEVLIAESYFNLIIQA